MNSDLMKIVKLYKNVVCEGDMTPMNRQQISQNSKKREI